MRFLFTALLSFFFATATLADYKGGPPIDSVTAQSHGYSLVGIHYYGLKDGVTSICNEDVNVCYKYADAPQREGACDMRWVLVNGAGNDAGYENIPEIAMEKFVTLKQLEAFSRTAGQYPNSVYSICKSETERTYGAFCLGKQGGKIWGCAFVVEKRLERFRYKDS